jgi:hypothetical protein
MSKKKYASSHTSRIAGKKDSKTKIITVFTSYSARLRSTTLHSELHKLTWQFMVYANSMYGWVVTPFPCMGIPYLSIAVYGYFPFEAIIAKVHDFLLVSSLCTFVVSFLSLLLLPLFPQVPHWKQVRFVWGGKGCIWPPFEPTEYNFSSPDTTLSRIQPFYHLFF